MSFSLEGFIYLLAGIIIIGLYTKRARGLTRLDHEAIPEIDNETFNELKSLLQTSYQRGLYLGISFLYLAYVTLLRRTVQAKAFGIIAAIGLFLYNIPPRNKVMRTLTDWAIDLKDIRQRGMRL